jgi:aldose sugar dehydrogenase
MVSMIIVHRRALLFSLFAFASISPAVSSCCSDPAEDPPIEYDLDPDCLLIESGAGAPGGEAPQIYLVASNLEVPWGLAFLPTGEILVTERPGRVRLVTGGVPQDPIINYNIGDTVEGGALGIAIHPEFVQTRQFYVYVTDGASGSLVNRVERWTLDAGNTSATFDRLIIDGIPAAKTKNGGRIKFSPLDGMLYIGTGDAELPLSSQDMESLAGKILRVTPDGEVPPDNPFEGSPVFISGVRDVTGFDFLDAETLVVADQGPDGDTGQEGLDELTQAKAGDNLGWPFVSGCETSEEYTAPSITWKEPSPPGAAVIYTGSAISEFTGDLFMTALDSKNLTRVIFNPSSKVVSLNEIYLPGEPPGGLGRLREAAMGPIPGNETMRDLYLTTSNCDGEGQCPEDKDRIVRISLPEMN